MKALLTKSEKQRLLEQFEKSGKTHAQFAEEKGLKVKTFSKWICDWHHKNEKNREIKFVEMKTTSLNTVKEIKIHKSGMEIIIPANLEFNQMQNLFTALTAL